MQTFGPETIINIILACVSATTLLVNIISSRFDNKKKAAETLRIYQQIADECSEKKAELIKSLDDKEQHWRQLEIRVGIRLDELERFIEELMVGIDKLVAQIKRRGEEPEWQPPKNHFRKKNAPAEQPMAGLD